MTYDTKSYELAEHFLQEHKEDARYKEMCDALAKAIQATAEDFIVYDERMWRKNG